MSTLHRREPRHWHHENGSHRMPDPRTFEGYDWNFWDEDERHYVEHLEEHERLANIPQPKDDDPPEIVTLFELIKSAEQSIETARELINARRLKIAKARFSSKSSR